MEEKNKGDVIDLRDAQKRLKRIFKSVPDMSPPPTQADTKKMLDCIAAVDVVLEEFGVEIYVTAPPVQLKMGDQLPVSFPVNVSYGFQMKGKKS